MARISTYDRDLVLSRDDILIGTDAENSNVTRNFSVGSLIDFISLSSDGVVDTNYYLSAITADQATGVITFTVNGTNNQTLTLGTAAFSDATDFAEDDISFNVLIQDADADTLDETIDVNIGSNMPSDDISQIEFKVTLSKTNIDATGE